MSSLTTKPLTAFPERGFQILAPASEINVLAHEKMGDVVTLLDVRPLVNRLSETCVLIVHERDAHVFVIGLVDDGIGAVDDGDIAIGSHGGRLVGPHGAGKAGGGERKAQEGDEEFGAHFHLVAWSLESDQSRFEDD